MTSAKGTDRGPRVQSTEKHNSNSSEQPPWLAPCLLADPYISALVKRAGGRVPKRYNTSPNLGAWEEYSDRDVDVSFLHALYPCICMCVVLRGIPQDRIHAVAPGGPTSPCAALPGAVLTGLLDSQVTPPSFILKSNSFLPQMFEPQPAQTSNS